jgi:hypothetical protein
MWTNGLGRFELRSCFLGVAEPRAHPCGCSESGSIRCEPAFGLRPVLQFRSSSSSALQINIVRTRCLISCSLVYCEKRNRGSQLRPRVVSGQYCRLNALALKKVGRIAARSWGRFEPDPQRGWLEELNSLRSVSDGSMFSPSNYIFPSGPSNNYYINKL